MALGIKDFTEPMPAWERREIERHRVEMRLFTLAHSLAVAGALCTAWRLGKACQLAIAVRPRNEWYPGCGREAPGWRGE